MIFFYFLITMPNILMVRANCPAMCSCLKKDNLFCTGRDITDIAMLTIPDNFSFIAIKNTLIMKLSDDDFQPTNVTLRLALDSNQISMVTVGAFNGFQSLMSITLSDNKIRILPLGVFDLLGSLTQLFLDKNLLTHLDPNLFFHLENLEELFLNKNYLEQLPDGFLSNLKKLKLLNLSRNKLSTLPMNIFSDLTELKQLYLYYNMLTEINDWTFHNLGELTELSLYSNQIQVISQGAFTHSPKLKTLYLSGNRLKDLPEGLFLYVPKITALSLYNNPLTALPPVLFGNMDKFESLWIYNTALTTLPNYVFSNLTNLKLLVLTRNIKLHSLPKHAFNGLSKVSELSLHSNNLTFLEEGLFHNLPNLQNLSLFNNHLKVLQGNLFNKFNNLQFVNLNNSHLQTISGDLFKELPNLQMLRLDENPWACDCYLVDFIAWLHQNRKKVPNDMSILCENPYQLKAVPILEVNLSNCQYTTTRADRSSSPPSSTSSYALWTFSSSTQLITLKEVIKSVFIASTMRNIIHTDVATEGRHVSITPVDVTTEVKYDESTSPTVSRVKTTTVSHVSDSTRHTVLNSKVPLRYILLCKRIFMALLFLIPILQLLLILLTCFGLFKIQRLYSYFDALTHPVVLLRVLIPLHSITRGPNDF
uniref:Glycoprotein V platelet n=1 Tax=Leptobrachium leishanense TaxID=445787 RepID=A0A8C5MUG3_9ANUR